MADNTRKTTDSSQKPVNISESNTVRKNDNSYSIDERIKSTEVRNTMPAPPNPNKDNGSE